MKQLSLAAGLFATAAMTISDVRSADACSIVCAPGIFVPADGATVPANLPALVWAPTYGSGTPVGPDRVTLTREDTGATVIPFTSTLQPEGYYLLVPSEPLVAGATYQLVDDDFCDFGANPRATFTVGPDAPLPTRLGTLIVTSEAQGRAMLATPTGQCSIEAEIASAAVELAYDPEAAPWRDVLHFETHVDGDRWGAQANITTRPTPGASWVGRGVDRIYTVCSDLDPMAPPSYGLPQGGSYTVGMRASLPGTTIALASDLAPMSLQCEAALPVDGSGGCAASGGGTTAWLGLGLAALLARVRTSRGRRERGETAAR